MITLARRTDQDLMPAPHPSSPRTLALVGIVCGPTAHEAGRAAGHGAKDTPALWEDAAVAEVDVEQLRGATLFSVLRPEQLERFLDAATLTEHAEGEALTEQGVLGHRFHLLVEGTAAVERDGSVIATIGPGDFVGEIGLLGGGPSTATVRGTAPIQCLTLRRADPRGGVPARRRGVAPGRPSQHPRVPRPVRRGNGEGAPQRPQAPRTSPRPSPGRLANGPSGSK